MGGVIQSTTIHLSNPTHSMLTEQEVLKLICSKLEGTSEDDNGVYCYLVSQARGFGVKISLHHWGLWMVAMLGT